MEETWKAVLDKNYEVSNTGRVRRLKTYFLTIVGRELKKHLHHKGYEIVHVSVNGVSKLIFVHKLVAEAFLGKRPKGMQINHKDLNKTNNHASNLEYVTGYQNVQHAVVNGAYVVRDEKQRRKKQWVA